MTAERSPAAASAEQRAVVLGTRGSQLALIQAGLAEKALREKLGAEVRMEIIRTKGDVASTTDRDLLCETVAKTGFESGHVLSGGAGRKGIFTAELERALIDGRIDIAVHSAKDLPSEMDARLTIAAVLPRGAAEDVLITRTAAVFASLPHSARVATGSVRRQRQVRWLRPDMEVTELRGNVPTRLRKFITSDWDGIILARVGLERLGLSPPQFDFEGQELFADILPIQMFVPAGGQGVIALQTRREAAGTFRALDDEQTRECLRAEREFLRLLHGDCNLPVGAYAKLEDGELELRAQVFGTTATPKMASDMGRDPIQIAQKVFKRIES